MRLGRRNAHGLNKNKWRIGRRTSWLLVPRRQRTASSLPRPRRSPDWRAACLRAALPSNARWNPRTRGGYQQRAADNGRNGGPTLGREIVTGHVGSDQRTALNLPFPQESHICPAPSGTEHDNPVWLPSMPGEPIGIPGTARPVQSRTKMARRAPKERAPTRDLCFAGDHGEPLFIVKSVRYHLLTRTH